MMVEMELIGPTRRITKDQKAGGQARGPCRRDNRAEKSSQLCETRSADGEGKGSENMDLSLLRPLLVESGGDPRVVFESMCGMIQKLRGWPCLISANKRYRSKRYLSGENSKVRKGLKKFNELLEQLRKEEFPTLSNFRRKKFACK